MVRLRCIKGPLAGSSFELQIDLAYRLGREPENSAGLHSIALPSQTVSRNHAEIYFKDGAWRVRDLKSFNGIRVNKQKRAEAPLQPGDQIEMGEFGFKIESELAKTQARPKPDAASETKHTRAQQLEEELMENKKEAEQNFENIIARAKKSFQRIDFKYRVIGLFSLAAAIIHFVAFQSIESEAKRRFLDEARKNALLLAENLGERSKFSLAAEQALFECEGFGLKDGVNQAFVLNKDGAVLCPIGASSPRDNLILEAARTNNRQDTCGSGLEGNEGDLCEVVYPVKVLRKGGTVPELVGFTRILFEPLEFNRAVQKFSQIRFQSFLLVVILGALLGLLVLIWLRKGLETLTEEVHLLYTGTAQNVERLQNFAAFDDLVAEVNRLISKVNQGLSSGSGVDPTEAGFLQTLLDQVFLLEERAVMAVDPDNQVVASSPYLPSLVPMRDGAAKVHITDAVEDAHLQSELMKFLNELSGSTEVIDKALSASDRILQARGMPIFNQGQHVATLLFFYPG